MSDDEIRPTAAENDLLQKMKAIAGDLWGGSASVPAEPKPQEPKPARVALKRPATGIDNLWMTADETIDWTDALGHAYPTDGLTQQKLWEFYHKNAEAVLSGSLDAYAEVLKRANPLGELTPYAEGICIRAPRPERLEAQFNCKAAYMEKDRKKYLCAMGVRIARDLFACLPVSEVSVEADEQGSPVMKVTYQREQLLHRNFTFLDPISFTEACEAEF